jgi:nucleotide-binding universal stress UspA family protein
MKVLLAIEGSENSQAAIKKCCKMFDQSVNTEIRIVSAIEPMTRPMEPFTVSTEYLRDPEAADEKNANEVVSKAAEEIRDHFPDLGVGLTTKVLQASPKQAIVEEAEAWGADLIIMGSHGFGFWKRTILGSVSNAVAQHAPCSVLIVRSSE